MRSCLALHRKSFIAVAAFSLVINILQLTVPIYLLQIFNRVVPSQSTDTLLFLTGIVVVALITLSILEAIRRFIFVRIGSWLDKRLGGLVLSGSIVHSVRKCRKSSAQSLRELSTIRQFFAGSELFPILDVPWTPMFIVILFLLHPLIGLITMVGAIGLFCMALINDFSTRQLISDSNEASTKSENYATALLRNSDVIEAMGMRGNVIGSWEKHHMAALDVQTRTSIRSNRIYTIAKFIRMILQITIIGTAGWLVLNNELSAGALIASVLLMRRAVAPMDQAISSWKRIIRARKAFQGVSDRLDLASELNRRAPLPMPSGDLSTKHISFTYPKRSTQTLKDVTFKLHPGEVIGLTGGTAAGKSTLARLLVGLAEPDSGYVRFGGTDLAHWNADELGPFIGYLPQDSELFSGTVQQNIARMGESDLDTVVDAAKLAGVHEMIMQFPEGYHTEIGEEGAYLSGGQRQRIALARAVYGYPKLLVFDEPDANLDNEGKNALANAIAELKDRGSMIVLISHQKRVLAFADVVLTLRNGKIESIVENKGKKVSVEKKINYLGSQVVNIDSLK